MGKRGLKTAFDVPDVNLRNKYKLNEIATVDELFELHTRNHGRFLSWERCYKFFEANMTEFLTKNQEDIPELYKQAELELGFYLASFGMLRGRSVLLSKDSSVYGDLLKGIFGAKNTLNETLYPLCNKWINKLKVEDGRHATDDNLLLATKILMGVFACIPAFDRLFKKGLNLAKPNDERFKRLNTGPTGLAKWSIATNSSCFITNELTTEFSKLNFHFHAPYDENEQYPIMRKIDIYFWFIGFCNLEISKKNDLDDLS